MGVGRGHGLAALACLGTLVAAAPSVARAQPVQALVIEGELPARAERVAEEYGATEIQTEPGDAHTLWRAPPAQAAQLRARLQRITRGRSNVTLTRDDYRSVLSPAGDVELSRSQRARLSLFANENQRVTLLRAAPAALMEHALQDGFGESDGFASERSLRIDLGDRTIELSGGNGAFWSGQNGGASGDLTLSDGELYGRLGTADHSLEIVPLGQGLHAALARGWADAAADEGDSFEPQSMEPTSVVEDVSPPTAGQAQSTIDVLVVFTTPYQDRAERWVIARREVDAFNEAVARAFVASRVRLNLIGVTRAGDQESTYGASSGNLLTPLERVTGHDDGVLDGVHELRARLGADIVVLIGQFPQAGNACGIAYNNPTRANLAFAVVRASCLDQYSFQHEVGHLFGLEHDWETWDEQRAKCELAHGQNAPRCVYRPSEDGHGYLIHDPSNQARFAGRTIMAYDDYCGGCRRFLMWSTPAFSLVGVYSDASPDGGPCGHGAGCPLGTDARENEAGALVRWAPRVAAHSDHLD